MGRSTYTPNTVSYLVVQAALNPGAGVSVGCSRSASPRLGGSDDGEHKHASSGSSSEALAHHIVNLPSTSSGPRSAKDAPLPWSQRSFDPDGDDLPTVTEVCGYSPMHASPRLINGHRSQRFLAPGESANYNPELEEDSDYGSEEDSDAELEMDEEELELDDDQEDEEYRSTTVRMPRPDPYLPAAAEVAEQRANLISSIDENLRLLDQAEAAGAMTGDQEMRARQTIIREGLLAGQSGEEIDAALLASGQAGTFFGHPAPNSAAAQAEDDAVFSPSSAVFHSHTLPFTLPSSDAMQLQRRASSGSPSRLR